MVPNHSPRTPTNRQGRPRPAGNSSTVPEKVIPNSSGARKPDSTTLPCAGLPKPDLIFSVIVILVVSDMAISA